MVETRQLWSGKAPGPHQTANPQHIRRRPPTSSVKGFGKVISLKSVHPQTRHLNFINKEYVDGLVSDLTRETTFKNTFLRRDLGTEEGSVADGNVELGGVASVLEPRPVPPEDRRFSVLV